MKTRYKYIVLLIFLLFLLLRISPMNAAGRYDKEVTLQTGSTSLDIQRLLDYNKNNAYNLTVRIPAGSYTLLNELHIYSNTTILAESGAKFMKNHRKGAILANDVRNDRGGYTTSENIAVIGGVWDSANVSDGAAGTESFRFIHATNITVKNATICNVPESSHLVTFAGVKNGTVTNCKIYGYQGTRLKEAIQLDIVHDAVIVPSNQSQFILYDDLPCDGILITNNEIYDYPRAIGSHTSVKGIFHKNITISGNNIHDVEEAGIKAYNYKNVIIKNNTITNAGIGILAYTDIDTEKGFYLDHLVNARTESLPDNYNILIEGNIIKNIHPYKSGTSLLWGDGIRILGSKARPLPGTTIKSNRISGMGRFGIYGTYAANCYIGGNTLSTTDRHGIYMDYSNSSKIYYNKLYSPGKKGSTNGGIGISYSSKAVIYKNTVKNAAKNGIFLYNSSTGCTIKENVVTAASDNAISVNQSSNYAKVTGNKLTGNTIAGTNNRGIFVYGANYASISYNTISGCRVKQGINTNNSIGSKLYSNKIY